MIRPGTPDARTLEQDDDAYWDQIPPNERMDFAFRLSIDMWRLSGWKPIHLAQDFRDLLRTFIDHQVRFLVVGAYALAALGRPRATGDLDV